MRLLLESPASGLRMEGVYFGDVQEMDAYIRGKFGDEEAERMYLAGRTGWSLPSCTGRISMSTRESGACRLS